MRYGSAEARRRTGLRRRAGALLALACAAGGCGAEGSEPSAAAAAQADGERGEVLPLEERRTIPGRLAFVSERDGRPAVYLIEPDGSGERPGVRVEGAAYPAAVAPDGSSLVVVTVEEEDGLHLEQLLLVPLDGGAPRALAPRAGRARHPSWSPDASWVVFETDQASFRDLYRARPGRGAPARLTQSEQGNFEPAVSPDGEWIAFVSSRDGNAEIYRMRADGSEQRRLTAFHRDDTAPSWSPDGGWIAFLSDREGASRVFLMAPDGTRQRRLSPAGVPGEVQEEDPVWSPDGTRIAYVARDAEGRGSIWVAEVESGTRRRVVEAGESPAWSPDGRHLAFVSRAGGETQIYLARADGTLPTLLTRGPGPNWLPRWVPGRAANARPAAGGRLAAGNGNGRPVRPPVVRLPEGARGF